MFNPLSALGGKANITKRKLTCPLCAKSGGGPILFDRFADTCDESWSEDERSSDDARHQEE
jgi:hypothetical protein